MTIGMFDQRAAGHRGDYSKTSPRETARESVERVSKAIDRAFDDAKKHRVPSKTLTTSR